MRLIDADALEAAFTDLRFNADGTLAHWGDRPDWCLQGREVDKLIHDALTVDAVPVVRCRECKHWSEHPEGYLGVCSFISRNFVMENGYCAWGERKEAEAALGGGEDD